MITKPTLLHWWRLWTSSTKQPY